MKNHEHEEFYEADSIEKNEKKARLRFMDLQRIESAQKRWNLTRFEREVYEKLAVALSPMDILIQKEQSYGQRLRKQIVRRKLSMLSKHVHMSPRERACFELVYVKGLCDSDVMERLAISWETLHWYKVRIKRAMVMPKQSHGGCR